MTDNTTLNVTSGGDTIRDIDRGTGAKTQVIQLDAGGALREALVSDQAPLPTDDQAVRRAATGEAPLATTTVGDPTGDFAGLNLIELVIDSASGLAFSVRQVNPLLADASGAAIVSDGGGRPGLIVGAPIQINAAVGVNTIIDTLGYQSLSITSQTYAGNFAASDDGVTWTAVNGAQKGSGFLLASIGVAGAMVLPCVGRFIRLACTTAGIAVVYLRNIPVSPTLVPSTAITQNASTSGQFGELAMGAVTTAAPSYTTAQTSPLSLTTGGALRVDATATFSFENNTAINGSNSTGVVVMSYPKPQISGGTLSFRNAVSVAVSGTIKGLRGQLYTVEAYNSNAALRWLHFYAKASAPTLSTDTPVYSIALPPNTRVFVDFKAIGFAIATGIAWAFTTDNVAIPTTAGASADFSMSGTYA